MTTPSTPAYPWLENYAPGVDWYAPLTPRAVPELLDAAAEKFKLRPCIDFLGKTYTYAEIQDLVNRTAAGLQANGLARGDRVGLFLPNTPYFVVFYFAILKAGGVVVNFNPLYAEREIKHQIEDSGVRLMVTLDLKQLHDKLQPLIGQVGQLTQVIVCPMAAILPFPKSVLFKLFKRKEIAEVPDDARHIWYDQILSRAGALTPVMVDPEKDLAVLQYTGGTTGTPKGAMLSHANITINAQQCRLWFDGAREGQEKMLGVIPLFHVFAMTAVMNLGLMLGAQLILLPRFDLAQLIKTIVAKKPTLFPAVATIYTAINNYKNISKINLRSIRYCISGGAPLPVEVKAKFEAMTGCTLVEGYGLTETSPVTNVNPLKGMNKPGHIGQPVPGTIVEIVDLEDKTTLLPLGERGEVCVRGPQVMLGYWHKPQETANVLVAGRLHTGDVGIMDADGFVQIVDRIKDMIIAGGYNIYPRNVEEQIYLHPAVAECIVAGVPDEYRGQTVKAWIKLKDGSSLAADELKAFLKDKLSVIELPKQIEFRDALPKTLIGKLDRKALLAEEAVKRG